MQGEIFNARVNSWVGVFFIGSFALGASLIIWHTAYGENPLANALVPYVMAGSN